MGECFLGCDAERRGWGINARCRNVRAKRDPCGAPDDVISFWAAWRRSEESAVDKRKSLRRHESIPNRSGKEMDRGEASGGAASQTAELRSGGYTATV